MRFTNDHQQALELDLWILSNTLSHDRPSHRRTIHFQRLEMAKTCFLRHGLNTLYLDWQEFKSTFLKSQGKGVAKSTRPLAKNQSEKGQTLTDAEDASRNHLEALQSRLNVLLLDRLISGTAEFSSRSFHASQYGMKEMARGFFLPFLTVTFGALARLRALAVRLQYQIKLVEIPELLLLRDEMNVSFLDELKRLGDAIPLEKLETQYNRPVDGTVMATSAEQYARSLASMGLSQAKLDMIRKGREDDVRPAETAAVTKPVLHGSDDDDVGESLVNDTKKKSSNIHRTEATKRGPAADPMDGNADCLKAMRNKTKKQKKKKTTKVTMPAKRQSKDPPEEKSRKKKKRTKRDKKGADGDFFDELFG